ncbi:MAG: serine/threonine protein kinase [Chloroflexi bacterium]|nr:serine/threonine protein kinase [Chloroflexota bacterium]
MSVQNLSGQILGQYELRELLGIGGMSAVYHGYQPELERHVAIKVLSPLIALEPGYAERFILEAKTIASLEHPNIVPVYDYGTQDGISYVAMRLLNGGTLAQRLDQRLLDGKPLPSLGEIAALLRQLASALDYAHGRGVIHRDLKTGNVMFDRQGHAYLVDFGIAKLMHSSSALTKEGLIMGTAAYMAPEQWRSEPLTPALDQYALGVLMYLLVTGRLPYDAPTSHELMYQHLHEMPVPAHTLREGVPPAVSLVLDRALAKSSSERYPNVLAFADAFREAVRGSEGESTGFFTFDLAPGTIPSMPVVPDSAPADPTPPPAESAPTPAQQPGIAVPPPPREPPQPVAMPSFTNTASTAYPARPRRKANPMLPLVVGVGFGLLALVVFAALTLFILSALTGDQPSRRTAEQPTAALSFTPLDVPTDALSPTSILTPGNVIGAVITPMPVGQSAITPANAGQVAALAELQQEPLPVRSVAFSPDNTLMASANGDNTVRLWNVQTRQQQAVLYGHNGIVYAVDFSPDGRLLASGGDDGTIRLWDPASGQAVNILEGRSSSAIRSLDFTPDGRWLASGGEDHTIALWDAASGTSQNVLNFPGERVLSVAFSPDGRLIASAGGLDGRIILWNAATGAQERALQGHTAEVRAVVFSPDGTKLASASADNSVRVWDVQTGSALLTLTEHGRDVFSVAYSPDGSVLASGGRDNTARLWDASSGGSLAVLQRHVGWVFSVAFNHDGSLLATGGGDGAVWLWGL